MSKQDELNLNPKCHVCGRKFSYKWYFGGALCAACYVRIQRDKTPRYRDHECYACGTTESGHWYQNLAPGSKRTGDILNELCNTCCKRIIYGTYYREIAAKARHRDIKFKNRNIRFKFEPKTGRCSRCPRNIFDGSCKQTQMHHHVYVDNDPLAHTEELCPSCHAKESMKNRPPLERDPLTGRFIQNN